MAALSWAVSHAYRQKIQRPCRARAWEHRRAPFEHRTGGLTFRLYPGEYVDRFIFIDGIYERRFLDLVRSYYRRRPGSVMLDIGANIGNHALYLSDCFSAVHCFDPNPTVVRMLDDNIRLNGLGEKIAVHAVGLSNAAGELPFFENRDGNIGNSGFVTAPGDDTIMLPIEVGDAYIARLSLPAIDFIKIDVENHEPEVFEGLKQTIARHRPVIAFEYQGQQVDHFARIAATMPGYVFAEARHAPQHASSLAKLRWHLKHQGRPELAVIRQPEARVYENILALPDRSMLDEWITRPD